MEIMVSFWLYDYNFVISQPDKTAVLTFFI